MCTGVVKDLAKMKFSGSPSFQGNMATRNAKRKQTTSAPTRSFQEKKGWKGLLSKLELVPRGFLDPVWWRNIKWMRTKPNTTKGAKKWKAKNRVKVAFLTENPPHTKTTISWPKTGIAEIRPVITVAPQNDIWPHGNTYPRKAAAITINKITTPTTHVKTIR